MSAGEDQIQLPLRLAVTGTPGSGKTSLAEELSACMEVLQLSQIAEEKGQLTGPAESREMDVDELSKVLSEEWSQLAVRTTLLDGHLSHLMPIDAIIVLRAHPMVIEERLRRRDYSERKVRDNVESEMLGGPWHEMSALEVPILELDSGCMSSTELSTEMLAWLAAGCLPKRPVEVLDWLDDIANGAGHQPQG